MLWPFGQWIQMSRWRILFQMRIRNESFLWEVVGKTWTSNRKRKYHYNLRLSGVPRLPLWVNSFITWVANSSMSLKFEQHVFLSYPSSRQMSAQSEHKLGLLKSGEHTEPLVSSAIQTFAWALQTAVVRSCVAPHFSSQEGQAPSTIGSLETNPSWFS